MNDPRWPMLKRVLMDEGWRWDEDDGCLHAPNGTMWFRQSSDDPNYSEFRDRMTEARDAVNDRELHEDLTSLVAGLDIVLRGN